MMRGHCEYEPIRDIIEKPSFEKRKCKKHLVRQVKVTVNKSGQDFQNFVFPLFSEKKQLSLICRKKCNIQKKHEERR